MIQKYKFCNNEDFVYFDDEKTVKELLCYAFDSFGYYEPFGMEIVTLFQKAAKKRLSEISIGYALHILCRMFITMRKADGDTTWQNLEIIPR